MSSAAPLHLPVAAPPSDGALTVDPAALEQRPLRRGRARRTVARRWRRIGLYGLLAAMGYYALNLAQVHLVGRSDQARPVDAIVVLGAAQYDGRPSPQLAARLDHVLELWAQGLAPLIVVTGGKQPGDRFTEADSSATYLINAGVPASAILREDEGHSSWQSLSTVADELRTIGARRVLLVSDSYHVLRIRLMAEALGLTAYVSPTRTSPVRGMHALVKEMKEAAGVGVGRVIGFDRLLAITG